jgi:ABC-2 type transport system permease protein
MRDKRLFGFLFLAPIIVMTLISLVIRSQDRTYTMGLYVTGPMSLFTGDLVATLEKAGFTVEELLKEENPEQLLRSRSLDGALIMDENFLVDRAEGRAGDMILLLEGADPMVEAGIGSDLREALSDVVNGLPQLLDPECPRICAEGVNTMPPNLETRRLSGEDLDMIDFFLPGIIPMVAFFFGYLLTALSFLRERSGGTLERLFAAPILKQEIISGYFLAFLVFGLLQSTVIVSFAVGLLRAPNKAGLVPLACLLILVVATAAGVGLFLSTFAKTEIQIAQFIPIIILPQVFLCGIIWPVEDLPSFLLPLSWALPLTYAVEAAREFMIRGDLAAGLRPVLALCLFCFGSVVLATFTMRRRIL